MKTIVLSTTAVLLMASLSMANAAGRDGKGFDFSTLDADGNGEITQAEITAFEAAKFAEADTDGDGMLSKEELLAQFEGRSGDRAERRIDRMISHLDADEDGAISLEERQSNDRTARMFERLDADDSGTISAEEAEKLAKRGGKRGHGKGGKGKRGNDRS